MPSPSKSPVPTMSYAGSTVADVDLALRRRAVHRPEVDLARDLVAPQEVGHPVAVWSPWPRISQSVPATMRTNVSAVRAAPSIGHSHTSPPLACRHSTSDFRSPVKSPRGPSVGGAAWPRKMLTVSLAAFVAARSTTPSPLKSPATTPAGALPVASVPPATKVPFPSATEQREGGAPAVRDDQVQEAVAVNVRCGDRRRAGAGRIGHRRLK